MGGDASWVAGMPEVYDRRLGPVLFAPFAGEVARRAAALTPRRVLELAAGTGVGTAAVVAALPDARLTATDLNPAMVAYAASQVPGPTWEVADAQQLAYDDGAFDLVLCQFGAMFFPDRPGAYAEARRVLAPGGTLLLSVWDGIEGSPLTQALVEAATVVLPDDPPLFLVRTPHGYHDPDQIRADLQAGGLHAVDVEHAVLRGRAESARSLAEGFCLGTPMRFALEEHGSLEDLTDAVAEVLTARLGEGPVEGGLAAWLVTARRD